MAFRWHWTPIFDKLRFLIQGDIGVQYRATVECEDRILRVLLEVPVNEKNKSNTTVQHIF